MTVQAGLSQPWSETQIVVFLMQRLKYHMHVVYLIFQLKDPSLCLCRISRQLIPNNMEIPVHNILEIVGASLAVHSICPHLIHTFSET